MNDQELKVVALQASAQAWSGMTSMSGNRSTAVLATARDLFKWLKEEDQ